MNFTGKMFIFLIFILAIGLMSFTVAVTSTQQNWREATQNLQTKLNESKTENQDLVQEIFRLQEALETERNDRAIQVAKLETELRGDGDGKTGALAKKAELQSQVAAKEAELRTKSEELMTSQNDLQAHLVELKTLRKETADFNRARDEAVKTVVEMTDQLNQALAEVDRLKEREIQLTQQLGQQQQLIAYHGILENDRGQQPPKVEGRILGLNNSRKMVEISIGSDDGILRGHELQVFRTGPQTKYLGQIKVVSTSRDRAVASIVPGTLKAALRRDDRVASSLR